MIDGISVRDLTPIGLLLIAVLMVFLGLLIPRYIYKEKVAEAKRWEDAYKAERDARLKADEHSQELMENSRLTLKVLTALAATFGAPEYEQQSGGAHAASVAK